MDYKSKAERYDVFGANMTVDIQAEVYSSGFKACRSCQCNCRLCRGHSPSKGLEVLGDKETEAIFVQLLAAA